MPKTVCCILLVNGREAMVQRAVDCFEAQSYESRALIVFDTGIPRVDIRVNKLGRPVYMVGSVESDCAHLTIGRLRNIANGHASAVGCDLIAHWDSDDWSHPRRLEEQVALLEASSKACVGYRELIFWDTRAIAIDDPRCVSAWQAVPGSSDETPRNEAWIYRNHQANWAAGASLLYRRDLWESQPFDDAPHEDQRWMMTPLLSRNCFGISCKIKPFGDAATMRQLCDPRMICQIHGSNSEAYDRGVMLRNLDVWRRAPEFDEYAERTMKL